MTTTETNEPKGLSAGGILLGGFILAGAIILAYNVTKPVEEEHVGTGTGTVIEEAGETDPVKAHPHYAVCLDGGTCEPRRYMWHYEESFTGYDSAFWWYEASFEAKPWLKPLQTMIEKAMANDGKLARWEYTQISDAEDRLTGLIWKERLKRPCSSASGSR